MRIIASTEIPAVSQSWFADFCSVLDLRLHDFVIPAEIQITQWTPDEFEATQTETDSSITLKLVRDPYTGVRVADLNGIFATGSRRTRSKCTAHFDSARWFEGEHNSIAGDIRNPFGVVELYVSSKTDGSKWTITTMLVLRGRGIMRPFTTLALNLFARRLRKSLERALATMGARISAEVQAALDEGPDASARRALEAYLAPPSGKSE